MYLKAILFTIAIGLSSLVKAQDASVDRSLTGIQTGFSGIWGHKEYRLLNEGALRAEIGFDAGFFGGMFYEKMGYVLVPILNIEPRWYYNLEKRSAKGKNTLKNGANFLTLKFSYHPDWFVISNYNRSIADQITIVPKWAIRRTIARHFTYEAGIGLGYRHVFLKQYGYAENEGEAALDLHLRIGYTF